MIDVTEIDKIKLVKRVYDLSRPQGLGMLHFVPGPLSDDEAKAFIEDDGTVSMDYVSGRACKFNVFEENGKLFISDSWYDHTDGQLAELLRSVGLSTGATKEHGCVCNCDDCRKKQGKNKYNAAQDLQNLTGIKIK